MKKYWILIAIIVLGGAFYLLYSNKKQVATDVPCLAPNVPLQQHLHPTLQIIVDGTQEVIPANIGLSTSCERALHTHDETGSLHVEAQDTRAYTLGDFFDVWGKTIERSGYTISMVVDGQLNTEMGNLVLKDLQQIIVSYTTAQ